MAGMYDKMVNPPVEETNVDTKIPRYQDTNVLKDNRTNRRKYKDTNTDLIADIIRRALLQDNKEAGSYRLSHMEKEGLLDALYGLKKRGLKSSEIEIARIAINWLLNDYNEHDNDSILVKVLESKLV